jgi:hypothetical protein
MNGSTPKSCFVRVCKKSNPIRLDYFTDLDCISRYSEGVKPVFFLKIA